LTDLIDFFARSALLTAVDASGCQRTKNEFAAVCGTASGDGEVLDGALSMDDRRFGWRVSVMGVHKIGDEKKHGRKARLKCIGLNSTLRAGLARLHVIGHSISP
jgi:hypothetical protein